jgi:hypothetical protein
MDPAARLMSTELMPRPIADLREVALGDLATLAGDGDGIILGVAARMVDGGENPSRVHTTIFNSAI